MTAAFSLRYATLADVETIVSHRRRMFEDMGIAAPEIIADSMLPFVSWLRERLENGLYMGWLAQSHDGQVVAGAGVWLMDWPTGPMHQGGPMAYVMNVFVEPEWRGQGLAHQMMQAILDWCRQKDIQTVDLHASEQGRPIYTRLGFMPTNEMRLRLE